MSELNKEQETKRGTVCYKSDLLGGKYFDSYEELVDAEQKYEVEQAEKNQLKDAKKAAADAVKQAITKRIKGEQEYIKKKAHLRDEYTQELEKISNEYASLKEDERKAKYDFCKKYGAYHDTITVDDVTYKYDFDLKNNTYLDPFAKLLDYWF